MIPSWCALPLSNMLHACANMHTYTHTVVLLSCAQITRRPSYQGHRAGNSTHPSPRRSSSGSNTTRRSCRARLIGPHRLCQGLQAGGSALQSPRVTSIGSCTVPHRCLVPRITTCARQADRAAAPSTKANLRRISTGLRFAPRSSLVRGSMELVFPRAR